MSLKKKLEMAKAVNSVEKESSEANTKLTAKLDAAIAAMESKDAVRNTAADKLAAKRLENALVSESFQELKKSFLIAQKK